MSVLRLLSTPILKALFITGVLGSLTLSTTLESFRREKRRQKRKSKDS